MAVNHIDGMLFASVVFYPVAAGVAAFGAGSRFTMPLFVVGGLAIGVLTVRASRFAFYFIMGRLLTSRMMQNETGWAAWIIGVPLMLFYILLPIAITIVGIYITIYASVLAASALLFH